MRFRRRVIQSLLPVFVLTLVGLSRLALAADKSGTRPTAVSLPSGPGSVEGLGESFEANLNSGSVRQTVQLMVPPGTAGMQPAVALRYDSGFGNGSVGLGWSLGVSSIQRRTDRGLPKYTASDTWLLDGAELVEVSPNVFRLKNESRWVRVRKSSDHFEVDSPDGSTMRYGVSPESRIESPAVGVFSFLLETVVDKAGNRIGYFYEKDASQAYLTHIE
jgi:Salmonella virulence plasmid 65kDa B protein